MIFAIFPDVTVWCDAGDEKSLCFTRILWSVKHFKPVGVILHMGGMSFGTWGVCRLAHGGYVILDIC